jgi:putative sterol carrier protein
MAYVFPSSEWTEQFEQAINSSAAYANAAKKWEGDVMLVIKDGPGIYLDLWHGKCRQAEMVEDPSAKDAEFKLTADMDKWKDVLAGKLDPVKGLMTRKIKLDGNLVKIMQNVKAAQELVNSATTVDTTYA